ncbi:MAG TPA: LamG-like jellyroll fold domain-containing protein, partial [Myxococcota bacterium]
DVVRIDIVVDLAGGSLRTFANGSEVAAAALADPAFPATTSDIAFIGNATAGTAAFPGSVDEVRLVDTARSADFIAVDAASRALRLVTNGAVEP